MFNKEDNKSMNGSASQSPALNMISEGTKLKGTINSQNDIRIAGKAEGEVISKGKLIVTSSGVIEGNVKAADADVAGKVEGELRVTNKLILRQSAVVDGDVYTKTLIIEEGAQMNGSFRMGADSKDLAQSSDSDYVKATKLQKDKP
ncbi:MAG: polymer-forming cytoskeletal protein [Balneolaceae bacterium]